MAPRRNDGAGARTLGRQIAALRSFARFCEKRGYAATTAFTSIRPPKQPKSLPKALAIDEARELVDTAEAMAEEPWIAARDTAVLMLLYGCGLRISEALGLTRAMAPTGNVETIRVVGKGGRERVVPVLPAVRRTVEAYIAICPFVLAPAEAAVPRCARRAAFAAHHPARDGAAPKRAGARGERHAARAAPFLRHAPPRPRRRSQNDPGAARPRQPVDDADLYEGQFGAAARGLSHGASAGSRRSMTR